MTEPENSPLVYIGPNSENLDRAATYFTQLARRAGSENVLSHLDEVIATSTAALEECFRGHDSFDVLAFLRVAVSPWDFSDFHESTSTDESSQAAQDIIALALLGMGLPRTPLTGENTGQPDLGVALTHAGEILRAARTRALIRGFQLREPLGALAGRFFAYELSVRGRQYTSIATELNSGLLGTDLSNTTLKGILGFTLEDVRLVRKSASALLNRRLFGARDRVGDAALSGELAGPDETEAFVADVNLMLNECRLFGAVTPTDVAAEAHIEPLVAEAVLRFFSTSRPADGERNPVSSFAWGQVRASTGCIRDDRDYLLLNGFLGEDDLRREVERGLAAAAQESNANKRQWETYIKRRGRFAEAKAESAISRLLAGEPAQWREQKYRAPLSREHNHLLDRNAVSPYDNAQTREYESDLLFVLDGVALCVEVKAGSVTDKARAGSPKRLATDLEKTLNDANEQADRLASLIQANQGVWTENGSWIDLGDVQEVHSIVVMFDDMGPLSLSMNELAIQGVIRTDEVPWIISVHDLTVLSRTFDHSAQFLEYLRRRRGRRLATMVTAVDELDVFMWFMDGGMYFAPDPRETAAQIPLPGWNDPEGISRFDAQGRVQLGTLTDPLDAWFYASEGSSQTAAPKPVRLEMPWVEDFLRTSQTTKAPGWFRFGADLVGLSGQAQKRIGRDLASQCRRSRGQVREFSLTTHGTTSAGSWLLTAAAVPPGADVDHLQPYIDAKQYQTNSSRSMLLLYDSDQTLIGSRYSGSPLARSAELDDQVAQLPLRTLAETFTRREQYSKPAPGMRTTRRRRRR